MSGCLAGRCRRLGDPQDVRSPSFSAAIRFVDKVAAIADAADNHPDILIRYDRVTLTLSTHDAHGLTERDFALAAEIETVAP